MVDENLKKNVIAISTEMEEALLSSDEIVRITSWVNADGICDKDDAIMFVAGPCSDGKWYADWVSSFTATKLN